MFRGRVFEMLIFLEGERGRIEAKAQAGGLRAIFKNVPKMGSAANTFDLGPIHAVAAVGFAQDVFFGDRLKETGPAGAGIELGFGREQREVATDAVVNAGFVLVIKCAAKGGFRALIARNAKLFRRQKLGPLRIGLDNFRR